MEYKATIGLEIHAELDTQSKLFCCCKNNSEEEEVNKNICPVCMGYPGALPCLNKEAVTKVLMVGQSIKGERAEYTQFDRKHYFYPDIPKGYQISQNENPLISGGSLVDVDVTRIHLEEDTAKNIHDNNLNLSLIDFNRSGVPLMELVTEPVIHSAEKASEFAQELQLILKYLGVSSARMEKGEMRVEANISISKDETLGEKVEVKNLNSFKSVESAIRYEIERQKDLLERGEKVAGETRGWNEEKKETFSQRKKESAKEYRYLKEQDLTSYKINEVKEWNTFFDISLPEDKRLEYEKIGLNEKQIDILIKNGKARLLFDEVTKITDQNLDKVVNYLVTDVIKVEDFSKITAKNLVDLISLVTNNEISSRGAKDLISILIKEGGDVLEKVKENNLYQKSNEEDLKNIVDKVISENKSVVEDYKKGKENSIQYLLGQVMKLSGGSANPQTAKKLLVESLK